MLDGSSGLAQKKLLQMAAGTANDNCCHPKPVPALPSPEEWAASIKANGGKVPKAKAGTTTEEWGEALAASHGTIPKGSTRIVDTARWEQLAI
jgi:hypothetical protein